MHKCDRALFGNLRQVGPVIHLFSMDLRAKLCIAAVAHLYVVLFLKLCKEYGCYRNLVDAFKLMQVVVRSAARVEHARAKLRLHSLST